MRRFRVIEKDRILAEGIVWSDGTVTINTVNGNIVYPRFADFHNEYITKAGGYYVRHVDWEEDFVRFV